MTTLIHGQILNGFIYFNVARNHIWRDSGIRLQLHFTREREIQTIPRILPLLTTVLVSFGNSRSHDASRFYIVHMCKADTDHYQRDTRTLQHHTPTLIGIEGMAERSENVNL